MVFVEVRPGGRSDVSAVLAMLDGATDWLVATGRAAQWGTEPHSTDPYRVGQITAFADAGGLWIAEHGGQPVGALSTGAPMPYVPPAPEPELYIQLLVTSRAMAGHGIGSALLDHARSLARQAGVRLLRVDCYAGGDGGLVRYYEKQGFTRAETFSLPTNGAEWPGQVLFELV